MHNKLTYGVAFLFLFAASVPVSAFASVCGSTSSRVETLEVGQLTALSTDTSVDGDLREKLSYKRTVSPFLPWNMAKYGPIDDKYFLHWSAIPTKNNKAVVLREIHWNYVYPNFAYSIWYNRDLQDDHTTTIKWKHAKEYGKTLALDVTKKTFADAFAKEVLTQFKRAENLDGIFFDWWHKNHPVPWRGNKLEKAMERVALSLRAKLGEDFILLGNTNWEMNPKLTRLLNGVFLELYKKHGRSNAYSCNEIAKIEKLLKFHDKVLRSPKIIALEPWRITNRKLISFPEIDADRNSEENQKFARLFSAMSAVTVSNGYILYSDNNADDDNADYDHYYYNVYEVDLGKAVSKPMALKAGVSIKQFERGYIAFNRRRDDIKLRFSEFDVTVPSMDAVFLTNDGKNAIP